MTCGIYRIYHKTTGKSYIGQSVNVEGRLVYHFRGLAKGNHHCAYLQRSFDKYGADAFETQILEVCNPEELTEREQFWMDTAHYMYGIYNTAAVAGSARGVKHSDEARRHMSEAAKGKSLSEETRKALSEALKGNQNCKGKKLSDEHKKTISKAHKGKLKSCQQRQKMSEAAKGKPKSEEHRQKMSKPKSDEARRRMSEAQKQMWARRRMEAL